MNEAELEEWLAGRTPEIAHVLQVRAALRIFPLANQPDAFAHRSAWIIDFVPAVFLNIGLAWLRLFLVNLFMERSVPSTVNLNFGTHEYNDFFGNLWIAIRATTSQNLAQSAFPSFAIRGIVAGSDALRYYSESGGFNSGAFNSTSFDTSKNSLQSDFWNCISYDTKMVERGLDAKQLAALPIWMVSNQFRSVSIKEWNSLKQLIEKESPAWVYWIKWYETVRDGKMPANIEGYINDVFPNLTLTQDNLETRIRQLIEATALLADDEVGELIPDAINDDANDELIIPPPRPAAIEPIWQGDKLVLLEKPPLDDGNGDGAIYALEALKVEIFELIESAKNANIDPRALDMLAGIASAVPSRISSVFELHRLGHSQTRLKVYEPTVESEWPNELRA